MKPVLLRKQTATMDKTQAQIIYLLRILHSSTSIWHASNRSGVKKCNKTGAHKVYLVTMHQSWKPRNFKMRSHVLVVVKVKLRITLAQKSNLLAGKLKNALKGYLLTVLPPGVDESKTKARNLLKTKIKRATFLLPVPKFKRKSDLVKIWVGKLRVKVLASNWHKYGHTLAPIGHKNGEIRISRGRVIRNCTLLSRFRQNVGEQME